MLKKILHIAFFIHFIFLSAELSGQACCTSGTPLLGSLDMSTSANGLLQFGLTYDCNTLTEVYTGSSQLDDDRRTRLTQTALLELNYGLNSRITITALFSYVNQSRSINGYQNLSNDVSVNGPGDALAMIKYSLIPMNILNEIELAAGAGIKAPVGKSEIKSNGILLPADMQPGTGSWDALFWAFNTKGRLFELPLNVISNISYRMNGENDRYGPNQEGYQFGNEFIFTAGFGFRTDMLLDFSLMFRFRHTSPDKFAQSEMPNTGGDWLIPSAQVFDGGPGKDGIPSLENPSFESGSSYLSDNELVIAVKIGDEIRAYPHQILDWHEIINDDFRSRKFTITYCPLTGSGISWDRVINGSVTTFGVSGLLYNTNLIPYDRASNSNWSQMLLKSVNGSHIGKMIDTYPLVETTWGTLRSMYPDVLVVSRNTGFSRSYGSYPYGGYRTNSSLIFPVDGDDTRLHKKERVIGIYENESAIAFSINSFNAEAEALNTIFASKPIVVAGSQNYNYMAVYYRTNSKGEVLEFTEVTNSFPVIMTDDKGNSYNIFGEAINGPDKGEILGSPTSFIAYWFAWAAFYPGTELVQ